MLWMRINFPVLKCTGKRHFKFLLIAPNIDKDTFTNIRSAITMPDHNAHYLIQMIEVVVQDVIKPSSHICVDEMLRKFMGHFKYKHRIAGKPGKRRY